MSNIFTRKTIFLFVLIFTLNSYVGKGQTQVNNLLDAIDALKTNYTSYTFNSNGAIDQTTLGTGQYHVNGIAYRNGYYYIARSRPSDDTKEALLIIEEATNKVVKTVDFGEEHPGGIQIYDNIMVLIFQHSGSDAVIKFYDLTSPMNPVLAGSYTTPGIGNGYCVGITGYGENYLVSHYYSRGGSIKFYMFDADFNKIGDKTWRASSQDRTAWTPYDDWRNDTSFNYETMSLVKTQENNMLKYYLIMYHNTNSADVFSMSDPNLNDALDINMVKSKVFVPAAAGFRYSAGLRIVDASTVELISSKKYVYSTESDNIISRFVVDSGSLGIDDLTLSEIKVFPNPASEFIYISGLANKFKEYKIFNSLGIQVSKGVIEDDAAIEVKNLSKGIYFLKVDDLNEVKFIKN